MANVLAVLLSQALGCRMLNLWLQFSALSVLQCKLCLLPCQNFKVRNRIS